MGKTKKKKKKTKLPTVGTVVQLKSGGPLMTVNDNADLQDPGCVECVWYVDREFTSDTFNAAMLRRVVARKKKVK